MRSRTDYIMGTDCRLFENVSVRDPRHNSDHHMVLICLQSAPLRDYARYLGERKRPPLRPPTTPTRKEGIFSALRRAALKPLTRDVRKNAWISASTWRLVDKRVSARRNIAKYQALIWRLGRAIKASLRDVRQHQAEEAGAEVEALMGSDPPLQREAWHWIKGWYTAAFECSPPLARVTLKQITAEQVELYSYVPPPGANIPISVVTDSSTGKGSTEMGIFAPGGGT